MENILAEIMKYGLLNFTIVFGFNLWFILMYDKVVIDALLFRGTKFIPIWFSIGYWIFNIWGIFNLVWFILKY